MIPEGYVKKAIEIASTAGKLVEVMEYALSSVDEFTSDFEAVNAGLEYYKLETIPEVKKPEVHKIIIPRESHWMEPFRIEYDGKYITLFGKDANYQVPDYGGHGQIEYEEMVLVPVVEEIRNIMPRYAVSDKDFVEIGYEIKEANQDK